MIKQCSLPDGWRWVRLNEVSRTISKGTTPTTLGHSFTKVGVPFLRAENVVGGPVDLTNVRFSISPEAHSFLSRSKLQPGDLLITIAGTLGRVGFIPPGVPEINCNQAVAFVRLIPDVADVAYACFACQLPQVAKSLSVSEAGGTIKNLNLEQIGDLEIPLPPLGEQKRIAAILNEQMTAVERARAAAEAQLEAAKALPAAYLRAVFSSPEAQQWSRKPMGELCEITARQVDPKIPEYGRLPHVNGENIESGTCRLLSVRTAAEDAMISGKYLFQPGDVLYSKLRPYLRKVTVAGFRGVCSADMYPVRVNRSLLDPHYTAWMLLSDEFTNYADEESRRARMPKLNRDQLFAWTAPVPSPPEQRRIAAMLKELIGSAEEACKAIEEELDAINKLPAALLRRAFNGELR
jgi:type I restriction enzyme S subunit